MSRSHTRTRNQIRNSATGEDDSTDLFDELPNSILESILSMLTIKDAVNTSMISRRWRHLWLHPILTRRNVEIDTPNIFGSRHVGPMHEFDNIFHSRSQKKEFARRVNTFLHLYQGNKVDSFKVTYFFNPETESAAIFDEWIRFAITKGVEVLELRLFRIFPQRNSYYVFPHWLLSELNSSSIKYLSLFRCALRPPVVDGFNQLRTLFLDYVEVDEKFMSHLFTVCLLLESLTLKHCNVGSHVIVVGQSLRLNDFNVIDCYRLTKVEIYAVNLTSLEFAGKEFSIVSIRAPRLDKIYFLAQGGGETLPSTLTEFASFPVLEKLHLQMNTRIPQRLPTFSNLKLLNLDLLSCRNIRKEVDLVPVLNLLKLAPLLEELNMTVVGSNFYKYRTEMAELSGFTHDNLRKVKMQGFPSSIWKWIWSLQSLPRIKHFLWRATLGILPSKANLFRRHIASSAECQICLHPSETTEHALLECPWAVSAWFAHPLSYRVPLQEITSFDSWLHLVSQLKASLDFVIQISFLLWRIWKHRCDCSFNKAHPDPVRIAMSAFQAANEFMEANSIAFPTPVPLSLGTDNHLQFSWIPPPHNVIRINTDASWHQQTLSSGIAAVARDMSGELINGKALKMFAPSPLTAEALAIREAVFLALEYPSHEIIITSDAKNLIDSLQSNAPISDWKAATVITQVRYLSSTRHFSWSWTSRKANKAAHHIAFLAHSGKCPSDWVQHPPFSLSKILLFDALPGPPV